MLAQLVILIQAVILVLSAFLPPSLPETAAKQCFNPTVRKEWRAFTNVVRANIGPVNTSGSYYDDFVYLHMIHFTGLFLPWHRWYLHVYEVALKLSAISVGALLIGTVQMTSAGLQELDNGCLKRVRKHTTQGFRSRDPVHGLGGWGDPNNDYRVPDGAFSSSSSFQLSYPSPHTIRRNFTLQSYLNSFRPDFVTNPLLKANATFMINGFVGDYKGFQTYFEGFNMVDKICFDWQHEHPANARAFEGGSVQALEIRERDHIQQVPEWPSTVPQFELHYAVGWVVSPG
ncbi:Di-copper centre-containing protein [Mycena polygramma]|nr:Di-copper centre-containing protein [Mycena polygramma]